MSEKTDTFETEDTIDRWIGILPDGTEYYGADTLPGLYEYETEHREGVAGYREWMRECGREPHVDVPPKFVEVVHRIIRTTTVRTITTTVTRQPRDEKSQA